MSGDVSADVIGDVTWEGRGRADEQRGTRRGLSNKVQRQWGREEAAARVRKEREGWFKGEGLFEC